MKRLYKIMFIAFILLFFILIGNVRANSISSINMDIYVDKNGDAHVTEIWNCNVSQGTECYHPYYNLGNSQIKDLSVTDGSREYTTISNWVTSGSLDSKAYKCGLNRISNGIEICWGISTYGKHNYKVQYTITNFVSELKDSQMIYWTLIPYDFSEKIGHAYIKIYSDFNYDFETPVWGYGNKGGTCYVYDGYIEMASDGQLDSSEYMTILVKFPPETFYTSNRLDYTFDYYLDMAEVGADHYETKNKSSLREKITTALTFIFIFGISIFAAIATFAKSGKNQLYFGETGNKVPKDTPMFRDIPCKRRCF